MRSTIASPYFAPFHENVRMNRCTTSFEPISQSAGADDPVDQVIARLPPLPSVIRYYDEFDDTARSIRNPTDTDKFEVWINGTRTPVDFGRLERNDGTLLKHLFIFLLSQDLTIQGIYNYCMPLLGLTHKDFAEIASASPTSIASVWARLRARNLQHLAYSGVKGILRLMCQHRLNGWSNDFRPYLAANLPLPAGDKYASVRTGTVFLQSMRKPLSFGTWTRWRRRLRTIRPPYHRPNWPTPACCCVHFNLLCARFKSGS
jgi:hypothetical protein